MTFCLDWRLCRFASVAIVPQAFFFPWALAGYKFRHILSHSCVRQWQGEAHVETHAGNLMNMFSYFGVSQSQQTSTRKNVRKLEANVSQSWCVFFFFWRGGGAKGSSDIFSHNWRWTELFMHTFCMLFYFMLSKWGSGRHSRKQRCGPNAGKNELIAKWL